jgi:hypothetical protein
MITYRIVGPDGHALEMIRNRGPLTLAEIAALISRSARRFKRR